MHINDLTLNALGSYNATVGVSLLQIRTELLVITPVVTRILNQKLAPGFSLNGWISEHTPLQFFNLTYMEIDV